jgi:hypothetical protein
MLIQEALKEFQNRPDWIVHPSKGLPLLSDDPRAPEVTIPGDVLRFYDECGGLENVPRIDVDVALEIVSPGYFKWAVKRILGASLDRQEAGFRGERDWKWYVIGYGYTDEYFFIDLSPERYEYCYFTDFYFFGQKGRTPVVATSFHELLQYFLEAAENGQQRFWEGKNFGDAYD